MLMECYQSDRVDGHNIPLRRRYSNFCTQSPNESKAQGSPPTVAVNSAQSGISRKAAPFAILLPREQENVIVRSNLHVVIRR